MHTQVFRLVNWRGSSLISPLCKHGLCNVQKSTICRSQVANITSKLFRDRNVKKHAPWPYETKKYNYFRAIFDSTEKRFDENTKVIVVDGNIASGKSSLAKTLAVELDMHFMPEVSMEQLYILPNGFDFRSVDHLLPKSFKCCDIRTFYENPHHYQVPYFQITMFRLRFEQYLDALAHLLNTGQGVVLERSVYSDFVFVNTLHKFGYLSTGVKKEYNDILANCMFELLRPHLVVYLDVPSEILLERIKKRNIPYEVNSKVLTKDYLDTIEHNYKQVFLKQMSEHAELLVYDWSSYGDAEVVVEDIERIDFEKYDFYDKKLKDWRGHDKWDWNYRRMDYTNTKSQLMIQTYVPSWDNRELLASGQECIDYKEVIDKYVPQLNYMTGYNPYSNDKFLFKTGYNYREVQKVGLPSYN